MKYKCRCSAIGEIMTEPKSKKDGNLSQTAKSHCESWLKEKLYDRRKQVKSKYLEKGLSVENDAIYYASKHLNWGEAVKNTTRLENDFIQGECDVLTDTHVHDIKASWDFDTFPLFEKSIPSKGYEWQVQGYMLLYNRKQASVTYALMDMPMEIIDREVRWNLGETFSRKQYDTFIDQFIYSHLKPNLRLKQFHFEYSEEKAEAIKNRVAECQVYINELFDEIYLKR